MVHRIEILSRNPAMSRMIPRTIMVSFLYLEIGSVGRLLDADVSRPPLRGVAIHP